MIYHLVNGRSDPVLDLTAEVMDYRGHVYRGRAIPGLQGAYVFMDMTGPIWAMGADGVVELDVEAGGVQTSFGEDPDGELWLLTQQNGVFKLGPG
jgi:hypothetical protein